MLDTTTSPFVVQQLRRRILIVGFYSWVASILIGSVLLLLPERPKIPLVLPEGWHLTGLVAQEAAPIGKISPGLLLNPATQFRRTWSTDTGAAPGRIETDPFEAGRFVAIPYVGYPGEKGISLYLECIASGSHLDVAVGNAHEDWVERTLRISKSWCSSKVRLVAASDSKAYYIGVGTPFRSGLISWLKESVFVLVFIHLMSFSLLLLPGIALTIAVRSVLPGPVCLWFVPLGLLAGYVCFFVYSFNDTAGRIVSILVLQGSVLVIFHNRIAFKKMMSQDDIGPPTILFFALSLVYLLAVYSADLGVGSWTANYRFAPAVWSSDNQLSQIVAEGLFNHRPMPGLFGGTPWKVSDRPPLLSGAFLLARPVWELVLGIDQNSRLLFYFYQITGLIGMTFWVVPAYLLLRSMDLRRTELLILIGLLASNGFVFFNSIYIWPKMVTAALTLISYSLLIVRPWQPTSPIAWRVVVWAAVSAGLAMVSHGSIFFGLVPLGFLLLFLPRYRQPIGTLIVGALVFAAIVFPWIVWQRVVDPPGNALVKYALAGTFGWELPNKGVLTVVRDAYSTLAFSTWLSMRWDAIKTLFGLYHPASVEWMWLRRTNTLGRLRLEDFLFVIPTFRFANLGWLVFFGERFWGTVQPGRTRSTFRLCIWVGLFGILFQVFVTWSVHIIAGQNFLSILLILIGLCGLLIIGPVWLRNIAIILHLTYFASVWLIGPIVEVRTIRGDVMTCFILSIVWLVIFMTSVMVRPDESSEGTVAK